MQWRFGHSCAPACSLARFFLAACGRSKKTTPKLRMIKLSAGRLLLGLGRGTKTVQFCGSHQRAHLASISIISPIQLASPKAPKEPTTNWPNDCSHQSLASSPNEPHNPSLLASCVSLPEVCRLSLAPNELASLRLALSSPSFSYNDCLLPSRATTTTIIIMIIIIITIKSTRSLPP